jgi:DNA-binding FadR family transcriptional regulator
MAAPVPVRDHRPADIRDLKKLLAALAAATDEPLEYFIQNFALHRRIARIGSNGSLRWIYLTVLDYLEVTTEGGEFESFDGAGAVVVHRALVDAIDSGDEKSLERALAKHRPQPTRSR